MHEYEITNAKKFVLLFCRHKLLHVTSIYVQLTREFKVFTVW